MENRNALVLGIPGSGKSTYIENAVFDVIAENDRAIFIIDPHGETVARIADALPRRLIKRTAIINPSADYVVGFNPLASPVHLQVAGYQAIWEHSWGPQLNLLLTQALLVLSENPLATLADLVPLFNDPIHRAKMLNAVTNPHARHFWTETFRKEFSKSRKEPYLSVINKIEAIVSSPIHRVVCQRAPKLELRECLTERRIVLLDLSSAHTGEEGTALLGSLFTTALQAAILEVNQPFVKARQPDLINKASLFADEFTLYGTSVYKRILTLLRKYGLNHVVLATQYIPTEERQRELFKAIFGTIPNKVIFNIQWDDAEFVARSFNRLTPGLSDFNPANITELEPFQAFINGVRRDMPPFMPPYGIGKLDAVSERSRRRFARKV